MTIGSFCLTKFSGRGENIETVCAKSLCLLTRTLYQQACFRCSCIYMSQALIQAKMFIAYHNSHELHVSICADVCIHYIVGGRYKLHKSGPRFDLRKVYHHLMQIIIKKAFHRC